MNDTNYVTGIIKILEIPKQKILKNNILVTQFRAQIPQRRNSEMVNVTFWGGLALISAVEKTLRGENLDEGEKILGAIGVASCFGFIGLVVAAIRTKCFKVAYEFNLDESKNSSISL